MEHAQLVYLIEQYASGRITDEELSAFKDYLVRDAGKDSIPLALQEYLDRDGVADTSYQSSDWKHILDRVIAVDKEVLNIVPPAAHRVYFLKTTWFRYAAILLLIAGTVLYLYHANTPPKEIAAVHEKPADIQPGRNKAILTLSDGSTIVLDSIANGALANQNGMKIIKLNAGKLTYQGNAIKGTTGFNTITTPRGGQYQVVLPDGSTVWLNAASSIRFPTAFGKERVVTVTGETYFEISKDRSRPFLVNANNMEVEVLGTSFNINAYSNERHVLTTLVDGRVQVHKGENRILLAPGEQAAVGEKLELIKNADVQKVTAWKKGLFNFEGASLEEVMKQLERWYDIEVVYEKNIPNIHFGGELSRDVSLASVIKGLEESEVHFRLEGRKLVVMQ